MDNTKGPVVLMILDGWGLAPPGAGNAISQAKTPYISKLTSAYSNTTLEASGEAVGLPPGEDGNSEVGHINIGAGSIIFQDLPRINAAIADGSFNKNSILKLATIFAKKHQSTLHLIGLIGSGGVHANNEHLFALIRYAQSKKIKNLSLHLITDGRDSPPSTALTYIRQIEKLLNKTGTGKIASITGRYYAMDRDFRWTRTEKAYRCLTEGVGLKAESASLAVEQSYLLKKTDEFIQPTIIVDPSGAPISLIKENDAVIFYNFRVDRPRQLAKAFVLKDFETQANALAFDPLSDKYLKSHLPERASLTTPFKRKVYLKNLYFATMTRYQEGLPTQVIFESKVVHNPLARVISENNLKQLRMSETEKERFVTYYFSGLREQPFLNEDWQIIPSPNVATYDLKPEMSTSELTSDLIAKLKSRVYQFILINFAAPDMVGHTGNIKATIKACEAVDHALSQIVPLIETLNGTALITADHGNAEELINLQTGEVDTEHSNNPVPLIIVGKQFRNKSNFLSPGILADVAPTILKLLNIPKPDQMTGKSLIE
jgi:2,3-bisphosphoglycerate-independent phosphoglycerate mutase